LAPVAYLFAGDRAATLRSAKVRRKRAIQFPFAHPAVAQILTGATAPREIEQNARADAAKDPRGFVAGSAQ
jgi:hypothetical protein